MQAYEDMVKILCIIFEKYCKERTFRIFFSVLLEGLERGNTHRFSSDLQFIYNIYDTYPDL